jgi:MFS family permease
MGEKLAGPLGRRHFRAVPPATPPRAATTALVLLTVVNLLNYIDRYVVPAVFESLKRSPLHPSDAQLGWLMSGFLLVYTLAAPVFGRLGDRGRRPRVLAAGVALWSAATALGGLAWSYLSLFVARAAVGVGEAAYGTIGPSLLADNFPPRTRGRAFAIFFTAIPVGAALGYVLGGFVDHRWGWRSAFFVAGIPGVLLAALVSRLSDPQRGASDNAVPTVAVLGQAARMDALLSNRAYRLTVLGYAAYTFALGGIATWMAPFLERVRGLPGNVATVRFGGIVVMTGLAGTYMGGWLGDVLRTRTEQGYLWLSGVATLLAAPLFYLALASPTPSVYWSAMIGAELLMFASTGPINTVIVSVVPPSIRTSAMALSIFAIHALGDVPSPALVGAISDLRSLDVAVLILPVAALVGGAIWTYAASTTRVSPEV